METSSVVPLDRTIECLNPVTVQPPRGGGVSHIARVYLSGRLGGGLEEVYKRGFRRVSMVQVGYGAPPVDRKPTLFGGMGQWPDGAMLPPGSEVFASKTEEGELLWTPRSVLECDRKRVLKGVVGQLSCTYRAHLIGVDVGQGPPARLFYSAKLVDWPCGTLGEGKTVSFKPAAASKDDGFPGAMPIEG